jgi:uncharacterized protein HemY
MAGPREGLMDLRRFVRRTSFRPFGLTVYRVGLDGSRSGTLGERVLGWLIWPLAILAIPVFLLLAVFVMLILLVLSVPTGFKLWRAYRRWRKRMEARTKVIEGEYWVKD